MIVTASDISSTFKERVNPQLTHCIESIFANAAMDPNKKWLVWL